MTDDVNEELAKRETKNRQQVNHAVSFNALKNKALDLLFSNEKPDVVIEQLEMLFRTNPVQIRKGREVPRKNSSDYLLYNYLKRKRRYVIRGFNNLMAVTRESGNEGEKRNSLQKGTWRLKS